MERIQLPAHLNIYPPYPEHVTYYRPSEQHCHSAAVSYVLYRIGAPKELWHPQAIDQITGRQPGDFTSDMSLGDIALLDNGAELVSIRDFDYRRYIVEGRGYAEQYHADKWCKQDPASFDAYWTDERLAVDIAACQYYEQAIAPYTDQITEEFRQPTVDDIVSFVKNDPSSLVMMSVSLIQSIDRSHIIVVTDIEDLPALNSPVVTYFDPDMTPHPFGRSTLETISKAFVAVDGILAVRKAQA